MLHVKQLMGLSVACHKQLSRGGKQRACPSTWRGTGWDEGQSRYYRQTPRLHLWRLLQNCDTGNKWVKWYREEKEIGGGSPRYIKMTAYPKEKCVPNGGKIDNLGVGDQRKLQDFLGNPVNLSNTAQVFVDRTTKNTNRDNCWLCGMLFV